jgi:hypothetical protein
MHDHNGRTAVIAQVSIQRDAGSRRIRIHYTEQSKPADRIVARQSCSKLQALGLRNPLGRGYRLRNRDFPELTNSLP